MNRMSPPSERNWEIYQKMINGWAVYKLAERYSLRQEDIIKIYFQCVEWREEDEGIVRERRRRR